MPLYHCIPKTGVGLPKTGIRFIEWAYSVVQNYPETVKSAICRQPGLSLGCLCLTLAGDPRGLLA